MPIILDLIGKSIKYLKVMVFPQNSLYLEQTYFFFSQKAIYFHILVKFCNCINWR